MSLYRCGGGGGDVDLSKITIYGASTGSSPTLNTASTATLLSNISLTKTWTGATKTNEQTATVLEPCIVMINTQVQGGRSEPTTCTVSGVTHGAINRYTDGTYVTYLFEVTSTGSMTASITYPYAAVEYVTMYGIKTG